MTATNAPRPQFTVDPIRRNLAEDPEVAQALEPLYQAIGWRPEPSPPEVAGWRLTLIVDGQPVEQFTFAGAHEGFEQARREGGDWLALHGHDSIDQWMADWIQASRRMQWDRSYAHRLSKRGF